MHSVCGCLPIQRICTHVAAFLANPLYNKPRPVIPPELSSQKPFTITFHHAANVKCYQTTRAQFRSALESISDQR